MSKAGDRAEMKDRSADLQEMLSEIETASAANMTISGKLLAEIAEMKAEIERLCAVGDVAKARRLAGLAVSVIRTGEPAKE